MKKSIVIAIAIVAALTGCAETPEPAVENVEIASAATSTVAVQLDRDVSLEGAVNLNTEPVTYSWRLEEHPDIAPRPEPYTHESHEFRMYVDGSQLAAGVELPITQPGALVAITPVSATPIVEPSRATQAISIDAPSGRFAGNQAIAAIADGRQLGEVGDFRMNPNMLAFRTAPDVGTGSVTLRIAEANTDAIAVVQVVERDSPHVLSLTAGQASYFAGDRLTFRAAWSDAVSGTQVNYARLRMPNGNVVNLPIDADGQVRFEGTGEVPDVQLRPGELVELEVDTVAQVAGGQVRRTAKTAFAVAKRTAALALAPSVDQARGGDVTVPVRVEVGSEGRFAVTGILYGMSASGQMRPFMGCQTAAMLEAGSQTLTLSFGAADIEASGMRAPFEIRDLRLQDQSRMFDLE